MRCGSAGRALGLVVCLLVGEAFGAGPFVTFPNSGTLTSPNHRYSISSVANDGSARDFSGTFQSLLLTDLTTGRSRKLCDYFGVAAVAWSGDDFVLVTQYLGKKAARALLVSVTDPADAIMLDSSTLARLVPPHLQPELRQNDHVFIEASRVEGGAWHLHVWGYGWHDPQGFRWNCAYSLREGEISCGEEKAGKR